MFRSQLIILVISAYAQLGYGQVTILSESMGTTGTSGSSIGVHESNNHFDQTGLTYSGTGDLRTTFSSSGYTGASGNFNVMLNTSGETFIVDGLSLSSYTDIILSYGLRKNRITEDGSGLIIEYSTSGIAGSYTTVPSPSIPTGDGTTGWYLKSTIILPNTITTLRFTSNSDTDWRLDDLLLEGNLLTSSTVDWGNLQFPDVGNINRCNEFLVYAKVYVDGVTPVNGESASIEAWIGYHDSNTDPSTWPSTSWLPATYNVQSVNDDEYIIDLGPELSEAGTYFYASRFRYDGGPFVYGAYNSGFWDGSTNVNGEVTVVNEQPDFANVDFPAAGTIDLCNNLNVYAQVYEPGITDSPGQGANITAWIGYNSISQTYDVSATTGWTWVEATYDSDTGPGNNDDQYVASIGADLPPGTYYYASRFQINCNDYSYGGIVSDNYGNFWGLPVPPGNVDIPYSGVLTVNNPGTTSVVISEIMYNTSGTDDEWIEICNVSGSAQDLSFYQIAVGGTTVFTFPCGIQLANNDCITISLGDGGGSEYNVDCPFTPDYANGSGTGTLNNSADTISMLAGDGTTLIDEVSYSSSDGANGNQSSLHVIDFSQDNSTTSTNWQEVDVGGSSGVNSLIPNCLSNEAIILVEGDLGNHPDISNGDTSPSSLDNTLFAAQFVGAIQAKSYRISSLGLIDVSITSINITGDVSEFSITSSPASSITYGIPDYLEITFSPTTTGVKTAIVTIINNDTDNTPYTFQIQGEGICVSGTNSISPTSGPAGTVVTVSGTDLLTATAEFNGTAVVVTPISDTELEVIIPSNSESGNISIFDDAGCTSIFPFIVINNTLAGCEGGAPLLELFISEVTDATYGDLSYIELYNATASNVNLDDYSIRIYSNGSTNSYSEQALSGSSIAISDTFVIAVGTSGALCNAIDGTYDLSSTLFGVNVGPGRDDFIGLYHNGTLVDAWGVFGDDNWMSSTSITGDRGFDFRRSKFSSPLPQGSFTTSDWNIIDWAGSGVSSCSTNDYSDIGSYDFSTGFLPSISMQPMNLSAICSKTASISVSAEEGLPGGHTLNYQWYYLAPGDSGWTEVPDDGIYDDVNTNILQILNTFNLNGYQYYCQVRENDQTCFVASDAVTLDLKRTIWDGFSWSHGSPDISTIAVIMGDFTTTNLTSFSCCQLFVESGFTLQIENNSYVELQNDLYADGDITIETAGSLVQNSEAAQVTGSGHMQVNKTTSMLETLYDYTYWSSPVEEPQIAISALVNANPNRIYWFDAQNYEDRLEEIGNSGTFNIGFQDDIDDNGDVWTLASGSSNMVNGLGYAATHHPSLYVGSGQYSYSFTGTFNTGPLSVSIYRNDATITDTNWNLVGNPYPSAISITAFFNENAYALNPTSGTIEGALYVWSQSTPPDSGNSGNEQINFSNDDYFIVNSSGIISPNTSNSQLTEPYIPSGQAFFISMSDDPGVSTTLVNGSIRSAEVRFTNAMRSTGHNTEFFRDSPSEVLEHNKIWLNLTSDADLFCQTLISYMPGATNLFDGAVFDAKRHLSSSKPAILYSTIPDNEQKFGIQGRNPEDLGPYEMVPLGFESTVDTPVIYSIAIDRFQGDFMTAQPIYLIDYSIPVVHDLKSSAYSFTSDPGIFTDRFSIVFSESSLSIDKQSTSISDLIIVPNGDVLTFLTSGPYSIRELTLYDLLGRVVYRTEANNVSIRIYLPQLSSGTFITKAVFSNDLVISKKAIKP